MKKLIMALCFVRVCFGGVDFDGADDYVSCTTNTSLLPIAEDAITISAWIKVDTFDVTPQHIFGREQDTADDGYGFFIVGTADNVRLFVYDGSFFNIEGGTALGAATWYHVAATWDGAEMELYLNGSSDAATVAAAGDWTSAAAIDARIGAKGNDVNYLDGIIDEVAVWKTALTATEVALLANARVRRMPLQIQPSSLIGYWPLNDEEDGTSADGDTFVNRAVPGTADGTGNDGANNTGLTAVAETVLSYP